MRVLALLISRAFHFSKRQAPLFVGAIILAAGLMAGAFALANYLYDRYVQETSNAIQNLSYVISDNTNQSLKAVHQSVSKVAEALQSQKPETASALEALADSRVIRAMLDDILADNPFLESVFVIGSDGRVDSRSRNEMIPAELIAGSEYMSELQRLGAGGFYLSSPFESYRFHSWMLNFSVRVSAPDGTFLGAVAGIVKLSSFSELFDKFQLRSKWSISLFSSDGRLLSWSPQSQMPLGNSLAGTPLMRDFVTPRVNGVTRARGETDGVERLLAIAFASDFPVTIAIAIGMPDVVAGWAEQARWLAVITGLALLGVFGGGARLAMRIDKVAEQHQRRALERQMAEHAVTLSNAIENITQGLAMFDRVGELVLCNARYAEMYGLLLGTPKAGATRRNILISPTRGGLGKLLERAVKEPDGSVLSYHRLDDGRTIAQRKKMLPAGGWVSTHEDVTAKRAAEEKIQMMASRDALTGLYNRFEFKDQLDRRIAECKRYREKFAVFYLDLDRFKQVNDSLGHPIGDELLKLVAERILTCVRGNDVVARLGGDEFAVLQRVDAIPADPMMLAERLIAAVSQPCMIGENLVNVGASIGIAIMPSDSDDAVNLLRNADLALYHAKQGGRGAFKFFTLAMDDQIQARRVLEIDLRAALEGGQFELYYQPIVSVKSKAVGSFEALIRWRHPQRGFIQPTEFIPLAEETGLIVSIGEWVLREACRMAATLPPGVKIGANVSAVQFRSNGFASLVASALVDAGIDGSRLVVEVTESVLIEDAEQAIAILHELRNCGIAIAMDDFGTGYSSLSYLRKFPFDKIKIDKSFVGGLGSDPSAATIVRAAIGLAGALGMQSVAEGIETEEQMSFLEEAGCGEAQGYLFSKPMPSSAVHAFLGLATPELPPPLQFQEASSPDSPKEETSAALPELERPVEAARNAPTIDGRQVRRMQGARA